VTEMDVGGGNMVKMMVYKYVSKTPCGENASG
jgi:hypothetical protein